MTKWIVEADEKPNKTAKEVIPYTEQESSKLIWKLKELTSILVSRGQFGIFDEESLENNIELNDDDEKFSITVWKD